jgi:acyl carrier protein
MVLCQAVDFKRLIEPYCWNAVARKGVRMATAEEGLGGTSVEAVKETLRRLIAEVSDLDPRIITGSSTLDEDIPLPSIAFVELQVAVEEAFGIEIDPVEVMERNTFDAVAALISEKIRSRTC